MLMACRATTVQLIADGGGGRETSRIGPSVHSSLSTIPDVRFYRVPQVLFEGGERRQRSQAREIRGVLGDSASHRGEGEFGPPPGTQTTRVTERCVKDLFWIRQVLTPSQRGQAQGFRPSRVPCRSPDRGLVKQQPRLSHANWNHTNKCGWVLAECLDHRRCYLFLPRVIRFPFGIPVDEEQFAWVKIHGGPEAGWQAGRRSMKPSQLRPLPMNCTTYAVGPKQPVQNGHECRV
jgi:hypothetical protein